MDIKKRRLIYILLIIIFLVTAPLIVFWSSGFRYDFKKKQIVKTGSLVLNSYPRGADIYIDSKAYKNLFSGGFWKTIFLTIISKNGQEESIIQKTPLIVNDFTPNEYLIELKKPGYHPWSKRLNVKSGKVTFANKILLFLTSPRIQPLTLDDIDTAKISPDYKKIAFVSNQELKLLNLADKKIKTLIKTGFLTSKISWSNSSQKIITTNDKSELKDYIIIDIDSGETRYLSSFKNYTPLSNLKWDSKNENIIYGTKGNIIFQINLFVNEIKPFIQIKNTQKITDFLTDKNWNIFYLKEEQENLCLMRLILTTSGDSLIVDKLSSACLLKFLTSNSFKEEENLYELSKISDSLILVADKLNQKKWVIDVSSERVILDFYAEEVFFKKKTADLIYRRDFEVGQYYLPDKMAQKSNHDIISRFSSEIQNIFPIQKQDYLLLNLNLTDKNALYALELDKRDKYNIFQLLEAEKIYDIFLSNENGVIYIWGEISGEAGIYKLTLYEK